MRRWTAAGWRRFQWPGFRLGPFGLVGGVDARVDGHGELTSVNARGEWLPYRLTHHASGRAITSCRTPEVARLLALELLAVDVDWTGLDVAGDHAPDALLA